MAPPVVEAVEAVQAQGAAPGRLIVMTPQGRRLDQAYAQELAREQRLVLLCGRYEGFDERIFDILKPEPLSIGDYVLSGGEVPAMVVIEAVMRLIPGVLGDAASAVDESFGLEGGLEYPHYTRPRSYRGLRSPRNSSERRSCRRRRLANGSATAPLRQYFSHIPMTTLAGSI